MCVLSLFNYCLISSSFFKKNRGSVEESSGGFVSLTIHRALYNKHNVSETSTLENVPPTSGCFLTKPENYEVSVRLLPSLMV